MDNENKHYKALYFDLCVNDLERYFSNTNPRGAYRKIRDYLLMRNFSHEQYSGYHSKYKTTDLNIFYLVHKMQGDLPWLSQCINRFEVTDVGENYNLMDLFASTFLEDDLQVKELE